MKKMKLKKLHLSLLFALVVFLIMLAALLLVVGIGVLLRWAGLVSHPGLAGMPVFYFVLVSLIIGTVLAFLVSEKPLKPLRDIMAAVDRIAEGDYSVRLDLKGPEEFRELSRKFNHMAQELGSVEMLRSDFVNNFSHEFKTPIVSIRGFAKALKWEGLSKEEQDEYLDIIISESERLSHLSSNVLYLSKIENQTILTDRKNFNLTEQIRLAAALLDERITSQSLVLDFDCPEYYVNGNEEMLRQVWTNLLDNAVKFSPECGLIQIHMRQDAAGTTVDLFNEGSEIPPETAQHIFDKFYQGDTSHATAGNGLGLAIARKIIDLHGGTIHVLPAVENNRMGNVFEVMLPGTPV